MRCVVERDTNDYLELQARNEYMNALHEHYGKSRMNDSDVLHAYIANGLISQSEADDLYCKVTQFRDPFKVDWDETIVTYVQERDEIA